MILLILLVTVQISSFLSGSKVSSKSLTPASSPSSLHFLTNPLQSGLVCDLLTRNCPLQGSHQIHSFFLSFQCPPANISMKTLLLLQILGALISTKRRKLAHLCCCYRKYQICLWSIGLLNEAYSPRSRTLNGFMEVHLLYICYYPLPLGDFCRGLHLFTLLTHSVDSFMHLL